MKQKRIALLLFQAKGDTSGFCLKNCVSGMGREEGRGFRMGNTGIPVVDSFRYLAKLIQYCKV